MKKLVKEQEQSRQREIEPRSGDQLSILNLKDVLKFEASELVFQVTHIFNHFQEKNHEMLDFLFKSYVLPLRGTQSKILIRSHLLIWPASCTFKMLTNISCLFSRLFSHKIS